MANISAASVSEGSSELAVWWVSVANSHLESASNTTPHKLSCLVPLERFMLFSPSQWAFCNCRISIPLSQKALSPLPSRAVAFDVLLRCDCRRTWVSHISKAGLRRCEVSQFFTILVGHHCMPPPLTTMT